MSEETKVFDPSRYLTKIGPADYLEVKWRLVWLRTDHPDAEITTKLLHWTEDHAVVQAFVSVPNRGQASGIGTETRSDFREYTEKAETKAIGRALAALGFGTQFCDDHDFAQNGNGQRIVDSPVDRGAGRTDARGIGTANGNGQPPQGGSQPEAAATDRQLNFIRSIAREQGMSDEELNAEMQQAYGKTLTEFSRRDASAYIEFLKSRRPPVELAS